MTTLSDVFSPGRFPEYTYVERRRDVKASELIRGNFRFHGGGVALVYGPAKSGKTTFVDKICREVSGRFIEVHASDISARNGFVESVLDVLEAPVREWSEEAEQIQHTSTNAATLGLHAAGLGLELAHGSGQQVATERRTGLERRRRGLQQVIDQLDRHDVILLRRLHCLQDGLLNVVAHKLYEAASKGLKIVVTSCEAQKTQLVKACPELAGYMTCVPVRPWSAEELQRIPQLGLKRFNLTIDKVTLASLSAQVQTPFHMHSLCLRLCSKWGLIGVDPLRYPMHLDLVYIAENARKTMRVESFDSPETKLTFREFVRRALNGDVVPNTTKLSYSRVSRLASEFVYPSRERIFSSN
jgi:hypothetical protein